MDNEIDFASRALSELNNTRSQTWQMAIGRAIVFALLSIAQQINGLQKHG